MFSKKENPEDMIEIVVDKDEIDLVEWLAENDLVASKSDARRLIDQGGVKVDERKIGKEERIVKLSSGTIVKVGKRKFIKIIK